MTPVTRRQVESGEAFVSRNQASPEDELLREVQVNVTRMSSNDTEQEEREPDQTEQRERQRRFIANHSGVRTQYRMSPYPQRSTPSKYRSILGNPPAEAATAGPSRNFFAEVPPPAADGRIPTFGCGLDRDPTCVITPWVITCHHRFGAFLSVIVFSVIIRDGRRCGKPACVFCP